MLAGRGMLHTGEKMKRYTLPSKGGTQTAEGFIPYVQTPSGIDCDVKILLRDGRPVTNKDGLPFPLRKNGWLVYALPGGGSWMP